MENTHIYGNSSSRSFAISCASLGAFLVVLSLVSFAVLHDDISTSTKMAIELLACSAFAIDIFTFRKSVAKIMRSTAARASAMLAIVPWYSLSEMIFHYGDNLLVVLLAHISFIPYLVKRHQILVKEQLEPTWARLTMLFVTTFFVLHCLASCWMYLEPRVDVDFSTEYNLAMYFIMTTLTTIGYGDITPKENISRIYTMGLQLMGVCSFGLVIGQVSRMIINADRRKEQINSQLETLSSLIRHYELPMELQKRTYKFFSHVVSRSSNEEELKILSYLPESLQHEIKIYMNAKPLSSVSLFKHCSKACHLDAAREMQQVFFAPGQSIIKKGEFGDCMYLIGHGQVRVHDKDQFIATLSDGQCFGEMAILEGETRKADVTAVSHCDLFVLSKEQFAQLLKSHSDLRERVTSLVARRTKTDNAA